ncbi:unnamed protein product [Linum trigynum]|uniref:Uncharacterized protein n=1 Tax=Linum trigynum TaxID=586398 RepID=A0AAV2E313_9ROSI
MLMAARKTMAARCGERSGIRTWREERKTMAAEVGGERDVDGGKVWRTKWEERLEGAEEDDGGESNVEGGEEDDSSLLGLLEENGSA